jgi:hypothetical protein
LWLQHGFPKYLSCDNGRCFSSAAFKKFCQDNGCNIRFKLGLKLFSF